MKRFRWSILQINYCFPVTEIYIYQNLTNSLMKIFDHIKHRQSCWNGIHYQVVIIWMNIFSNVYIQRFVNELLGFLFFRQTLLLRRLLFASSMKAVLSLRWQISFTMLFVKHDTQAVWKYKGSFDPSPSDRDEPKCTSGKLFSISHTLNYKNRA